MSNEIQANKMIFKVLTKTVEQYLKFGSKLKERKEFNVNALLDLQLSISEIVQGPFVLL